MIIIDTKTGFTVYCEHMKPLFLQYANTDTLKGMIEDHSDRHQAYCERHGYHYFPVIRVGEHFGWFDKIRLIRSAMITDQYSHVFWLDADCFVVDGSQDMRDTLPVRWSAFAFTIHPKPWHHRSFHFNAGVQYYQDGKQSRNFLQAVIDLEGCCRDEYDQTAINDLLLGENSSGYYQYGLHVLPDKWNRTLGVHDLDPDNPPVVAAFHGTHFPGKRREIMQEWAERLPYR